MDVPSLVVEVLGHPNVLRVVVHSKLCPFKILENCCTFMALLQMSGEWKYIQIAESSPDAIYSVLSLGPLSLNPLGGES